MFQLAKHHFWRKVFFWGISLVFMGGVASGTAYLTIQQIAGEQGYQQVKAELDSQVAELRNLKQLSQNQDEEAEKTAPGWTYDRGNDLTPSGLVPYLAGAGILVEGNTITNTGITSLESGDGISISGKKITNNDRGSDQSIFKNITIDGQATLTAGNNNDELTLIAGNGIGFSTDTGSKALTISASGSSGNGWTTSSGLLSLTTTSDNLAVGGTTSLGKVSILGDSDEKQLVVRGNGTQNSALLELQNNAGTSLASFNGSGGLTLPSNGLTVGSTQLVLSGGRVGIGTSSPGATLDVNGNIIVGTNQGITLTASTPSSGNITRLITLKASSQYDRPWISHYDYTNRHGASFGLHHTNFTDGGVDKTWEIKTSADPNGSQPSAMLTRFAIEYDTDLADVIFGDIETIGIHNNYGDRIEFVAQMRDSSDIASHAIGQWITELGAGDSTLMSFDTLTLTGTADATLRFFRETNTTGQRRIVVMKGDGTATETFTINADTGQLRVFGNGETAFWGSGDNTASYNNFQSNRAMVGYDGSSAVLQAGINKNLKLNVNNSSFGTGTALTILSTGLVGVNTTDPGSWFQVNGNAAIGYSATTAAPSNGLAVSGSVGIGTTNPLAELEVRHASSPELRLAKSTTSYFKLESTTTGAKIADIAATGEALLDFDPVTSDGTSKSSVRLFRNVTTTNTGTGFSIYAADGTSSVQSFFGAKGNSYFNILSGNFGIGTSSFGGSASKVLALGNGSAPTSSIVDGVQLFATDFDSGDGTATSELRVRDEDGNVTTLSPHNFSLLPTFSQQELDWAYYSEKGDLAINANMAEALRKVEQLSGEQLIFIKNTKTGEYISRDIQPLTAPTTTLTLDTTLPDHHQELVERLDKLVPRSELEQYVTWQDKVWTFLAQVVFRQKVEFQDEVKVAGDLQLGGRNTGQFVLPAGAKRVRVAFPQTFAEKPLVFVTPSQSVEGLAVVTVEKDHFVVQVSQSVGQEVSCNWLAMVGNVAGAQVEVLEQESLEAVTTNDSSQPKQTVIETLPNETEINSPEEKVEEQITSTENIATRSANTQ